MTQSAPAQNLLFDPDLLRTFIAIVETGSFASAAEAVHRTPSAVSMQVKKLEETLGRALFIRDSRTVTLTRDGAMLLPEARRLLALNRDIMARFIQPDVSGEVRLGAPDDAAERYLPDMLKRLAESHPGLTVNVVADASTRLAQQVAAGELDLALVTCEAGIAGTEGAEVLQREPLVWAGLRGGIAAEKRPLPVSVWEDDCPWRRSGLEALTNAGIAHRIAFHSAHISGQRAAVLADLAVAPVPRSALGGDIVDIGARFGLPALGSYSLGLLVKAEPGCAVAAAADHVRASFARASEAFGIAAE